MIGHIVGYGAQVFFSAGCSPIVPMSVRPLCQPAGIVIHEFVVEPITDAILANGIRALFTGAPLKWPNFTDPIFIVTIAGSILCSQLALTHSDNYWIEGLAGIVGAFIGDCIGKKFFGAEAVTARGHS